MKLHADIPGGFRTVTVLLVVIILIMLGLWRPWEPIVRATDRTISVTGSATVEATPDEYVFSPSYTFTNSDQQTALNDLATKSDQLVNQLKALGVASTDIKTNANGYQDYGYYLPTYSGGDTYTLSVTVTVHDAALAQKVQDYLVTTGPSGEITPNVQFSTTKQQDLQRQARDQAEMDARSQADESAKNLGFSVGAVKSVTDGSLNYPQPIGYGGLSAGTNLDVKSSLPIQPGLNDLSYSVQVVYYIR